MKHYGIEMEGKFYSEQLASVPGWSADDEGRIIYDQSTDSIYFGSGSEWVELAEMSDITSNSFPSGTKMIFGNSTPVGWTKDLTEWTLGSSLVFARSINPPWDDGGTDSVDVAGWTTNVSTDSNTSGLDNHNHGIPVRQSMIGHIHYNWPGWASEAPDPNGAAWACNTQNAGSGSNHSHGMNNDTYYPKYQFVLAATKD